MADNIVNNFKGIPMGELIGAPLTAACEAQIRLAQATFNFVKQIAFEDEKGTQTRLVKFKLQRPTETPTGYDKVDIEVQAPFLGLVPIPALLIEDVNVEFQMEVAATEQSKTNTAAEVNTTAKASWGLFSKASIEVQGKVTSSRENTRSTNQTAKYQVRVNARQQVPTEGLSRLMDVMAQCTAPLPSSNTPAAPEKK
ncbi:DUF2589 domain-containing protein [Breznakiella homolactica]|uniref:DUF2589 domain-containing protein n=1 Tax=Breznakiella homolactica TaxID=2798577 RepID=A0A7T7XPJ8_9SPIR|nr:DUF2589 domain-containing protein [Breznakiella homolactica]QQO10140.1 DUF2589 domain-containing protein [Breznakiella homolactica]